MNNEVLDILLKREAVLKGHFLLSSGRHSDTYCQCAKLLEFPEDAEKVLKIACDKLKNIEFDVVVGPAMGGIIVAYEIGRQMGKPAMFTERTDGKMALRRGFTVEKGQKVIIAEDVVTTGKSSLETLEALKELGAEVVGIACIVDRSKEKIDLPLYPCIKLDIESFEKENCPMCKKGLPFVKPGSRKEI